MDMTSGKAAQELREGKTGAVLFDRQDRRRRFSCRVAERAACRRRWFTFPTRASIN